MKLNKHDYVALGQLPVVWGLMALKPEYMVFILLLQGTFVGGYLLGYWLGLFHGP